LKPRTIKKKKLERAVLPDERHKHKTAT